MFNAFGLDYRVIVLDVVANSGADGLANPPTILAFYLLNVAQCGTVFSVLLLLRSVGFRFVRVPLQPIRETAV